jgi:hypothetical protein
VDLAAISNWSRRWLADGVRLSPPGTTGEWLHIKTKQRPLRPFSRLLGDGAYGELEKLTTVEGEYAGLVVLAEPGGIRVVAMVLGDDSYELVEAHTPDPLRTGWFRDLVYTIARFYPLGLGRPRRRPYVYRPPDGWQGVPRSGSVVWLNSEYPRVSGRIAVFDARPLKWFAPGAVDRLLFVDENPFATLDPARPPVSVMIRAGFGGTMSTASGRSADGTQRVLGKVVLQDERYYYGAQLDATAAEWSQFSPLLEVVVRSIEPQPSGELERPASQFIHWIE